MIIKPNGNDICPHNKDTDCDNSKIYSQSTYVFEIITFYFCLFVKLLKLRTLFILSVIVS